MRSLASLPILACCVLTACDGTLVTESVVPEHSSQIGAIVNGSAPLNIPEHRAVVALHLIVGADRATAPFCTGTLISDTVVLTAAHCLAEHPTNPARQIAADELLIFFGDDPFNNNGDRVFVRAVEAEIHPNYDPRRILNDIAVVVLDEPGPVAPIPALPSVIGVTNADLGARLNFVGFGQTEIGSSGVKLQTDGVLGGLGCVLDSCPNGGDAATQISYAMPQTGPCFGDSGGPAFFYRNGNPYVLGVTSYGDQNCNVYGVSARADGFDDFLRPFLGNDVAPPTVSVNQPVREAQVAPGFTVDVTAADEESVYRVDLFIDGQLAAVRMAEPWVFETDASLSLGRHTLQVVAYDSQNSASTTLDVVVSGNASTSTGSGNVTDGGGASAASCSAMGPRDGGFMLGLVGLGLLLAVRRRGSAPV